MQLSTIQENEILSLIESGNILNAVKKYREFTNTDLINANKFVSELAEGVEVNFTALPEPNFDIEIIASLDLTETQYFIEFVTFQKKIMKDLYGFNYQPTLDAKLIKIPEGNFSIFEVIKKSYPNSKPSGYSVCETTWVKMKEQVSGYLSDKGDYGSQPNPSIIPLLDNVVNSYWDHVEKIISDKNVTVFSYLLEDGLPGTSVFWNFAYFIFDSKKNDCLGIVGSCSD